MAVWMDDTMSDLDTVARLAGALEERRVSEIMNRGVLQCPPDLPVSAAARMMSARHCSSIVITDGDGHALGIWTEHDALALDLEDPAALAAPMSAVMSSPVRVIPDDMLLRDLVTRFNAGGVRHFVVARDDAVVGVVTHTDVVRRQGFLQYLTLRAVDALVQGQPLNIAADRPIAEAARAMRAVRADAIVVTGPDGRAEGILTGRDMVRLAARNPEDDEVGGNRPGATCGAVCSRPLIGVARSTPLVGAHRLMQERGIRHLVVTADDDPGAVIALLSHRDILEGIEVDYLRTLQDALTRQKAATQAGEERQRRIIEASHQGYVEIGPDRRIVRVNTAIQRLLGRTADDLLGRTPDTLCSPETRDHCMVQLARVEETDHRTYEVTFLHADGHAVPLHVAASSLRDEAGRFQGAFAFFTDLSAIRDAQAQLNGLVDKVSRSNAELEAFAYVASHDLQEPLRMISSYLNLVERRYGPHLDDQGREFIGFAVDGAKRMQSMIADLLDYSRVDRKGNPFTDTPLEAAVDAALKNLGVALEECGGAVTRDPLPTLRADAMQMVRLFQNVIGNAVKYRDPARPPIIHVSAAPDGGSPALWRVSVADNGIGLENQFADRIFQVFQRLHGRDDFPGNGIGLAVCKRIVERHGGRMWVDSVPGAGSTFHFTLACDPEA